MINTNFLNLKQQDIIAKRKQIMSELPKNHLFKFGEDKNGYYLVCYLNGGNFL